MALVLPNTARLKKLYHLTFEVAKRGIGTIYRHTLLVNPQEFTQVEPARNTVTQTLGGAFVQDFGQGLPQVTISGITGYKARKNVDGEVRDGFEEFRHFRETIYRMFIRNNEADLVMYWYNWEDEEYYAIQPHTFRLQRNKAEPLLYRYEFNFTCLRRANIMPYQVPKNTKGAIDFKAVQNGIGKAMSTLNESITTFGTR